MSVLLNSSTIHATPGPYRFPVLKPRTAASSLTTLVNVRILSSAPRLKTLFSRPRDSTVLRAGSNPVEPGQDGSEEPTLRQKQWQEANNEVFDKLISIFRERSRDENRKLIAHSKQWPTLAEGVFYRLEELTKRSASNLREQAKLRNLLRSIRNIHQEYKRYRAITKKFEESPEEDWEGLVAHNHEYMQGPFFEFWERTLSSRDQTEEQAQANAAMLSRVAALVTAMQKAAADEQSLQDAGSRFHSLLEKINSLEDADKEIDSLQREGKLDPALMLTMAKAYSGVKESPYVKEEVKDIMAHLYFKAKESAARDQPPEVRILKHLLTIEGSRELREALDQAFTPPEDGAPSEGAEQDYLFTTPPKLTQYVDSILVAYDTQREGTNLLGQTAKLMDPAVITRLRDIGQLIRRSYM